jgi:hypothetical protein
MACFEEGHEVHNWQNNEYIWSNLERIITMDVEQVPGALRKFYQF